MVFIAALLGGIAAAIIMFLIYFEGKRNELWRNTITFRILAAVLLVVGFFRLIVSFTLKNPMGVVLSVHLLLFGLTFSLFAEISKIIRQLQQKSSQE